MFSTRILGLVLFVTHLVLCFCYIDIVLSVSANRLLFYAVTMNGNVNDISNWVSLRYAPHVQRFHGCGPSATFDLFDWVLWHPQGENLTRFEINEPKKILCQTTAESVNLLLEKVNFSSKPSVVFAGGDTLLSTFIDKTHQIKDRFSNIFYEAKDIDSDFVRSFSMGFISFYLRDSVYENIYRAIEYSNQIPKSSLVLAA